MFPQLPEMVPVLWISFFILLFAAALMFVYVTRRVLQERRSGHYSIRFSNNQDEGGFVLLLAGAICVVASFVAKQYDTGLIMLMLGVVCFGLANMWDLWTKRWVILDYLALLSGLSAIFWILLSSLF